MKSAIFCEHANESPVTRPCRCPPDCYCKGEGGCRPHRAEEEFVERMARSGRAVKVVTADGAFVLASGESEPLRGGAVRATTTDALKILHMRYVNGDPEMEMLVDEARIEGDAEQAEYDNVAARAEIAELRAQLDEIERHL